MQKRLQLINVLDLINALEKLLLTRIVSFKVKTATSSHGCILCCVQLFHLLISLAWGLGKEIDTHWILK